jgi:hypothetical protein
VARQITLISVIDKSVYHMRYKIGSEGPESLSTGEPTYVKRNIEARSRKHFCRGKAICYIY